MLVSAAVCIPINTYCHTEHAEHDAIWQQRFEGNTHSVCVERTQYLCSWFYLVTALCYNVLDSSRLRLRQSHMIQDLPKTVDRDHCSKNNRKALGTPGRLLTDITVQARRVIRDKQPHVCIRIDLMPIELPPTAKHREPLHLCEIEAFTKSGRLSNENIGT